jgi:protein disulfide-isomerase
MKLEIWLDYLSPLCYKQHKSLEDLLKNYKFENLEILYRSYEMMPFFEPDKECTFYKIMSKHHMISENEAKIMVPNLVSEINPVKVFDAHRISHLAKKEKCAFLYNKNLFDAYYIQHKDISNHDILREIGLASGIELEKINEVLSSDLYKCQVNLNRENAIVKGIFELPHMRIDGKYKMNGLHDTDAFLKQLNHANALYKHTDYCEGENCNRKKAK